MLIVYSLAYLVGDFLRAFFYRSDTSDDAIGISVMFFFLSIWLVLDAFIYYQAFLDDMQLLHSGSNLDLMVEGTGLTSTQRLDSEVGIHSDSEVIQADQPEQTTQTANNNNTNRPPHPHIGLRKEETFMQIYKRWTFYLNTEVGMAYFLNIGERQ